MALELITTGDGSHSLLNTNLNETYHSVHGALQESMHVFIQEGIENWHRANPDSDVHILEVGFGTGLNVLLAAGFAQTAGIRVDYTSLETFPLDAQLAKGLNYPMHVKMEDPQGIFRDLQQCSWNERHIIRPYFILEKRLGEVQQVSLTPSDYGVIFYDAFAPSKQPEMWEVSVLAKVVTSMKPGGVFVTYCAKGQLKRDLKSLGLIVETLPGPPGKKEMVRAIKRFGDL